MQIRVCFATMTERCYVGSIRDIVVEGTLFLTLMAMARAEINLTKIGEFIFFSGSHEVVLGFVFSSEFFLFSIVAIVVVGVFRCCSHEIVDHGRVVVHLIALAATRFESGLLSLFVLSIPSFLLLLLLVVEEDLQVIDDLLDLL